MCTVAPQLPQHTVSQRSRPASSRKVSRRALPRAAVIDGVAYFDPDGPGHVPQCDRDSPSPPTFESWLPSPLLLYCGPGMPARTAPEMCPTNSGRQRRTGHRSCDVPHVSIGRSTASAPGASIPEAERPTGSVPWPSGCTRGCGLLPATAAVSGEPAPQQAGATHL